MKATVRARLSSGSSVPKPSPGLMLIPLGSLPKPACRKRVSSLPKSACSNHHAGDKIRHLKATVSAGLSNGSSTPKPSSGVMLMPFGILPKPACRNQHAEESTRGFHQSSDTRIAIGYAKLCTHQCSCMREDEGLKIGLNTRLSAESRGAPMLA